MVDMTPITAVTEKQEMALESYTKARERVEEARAQAAAANETMFESLLNNDPEEGSVEDQVAAAEKNFQCERDAERAWARYETALVRYAWEEAQARKMGIIQ